MSYDPFRPSVIDSWDWPAQVAIWRERAIHEAERAARWQRIAETAASIPSSDKEPAL